MSEARAHSWFVCGALAAECALLLAASAFGDFSVAENAVKFVGLMFAAGAGFLAAVTHFASCRNERKQRQVFWIAAIGLRLSMLGCAPGDDLWRYIWEGRVQLHGGNPYLVSPDAPALAGLRDATWEKMNHREWPAIYPPAAELVFKGIARLSSASQAFKFVFIGADLLTAFLLLRLCANWTDAAWYAWNPAVIYAFAGGAHYDSLMLLAMTASILLLRRASDGNGSRKTLVALSAAACLGVAIAFKIIPIFLVPAFACALGWRAPVLAISAAIPLALTIPFGGIGPVFSTLKMFADVARFNDLVWWALEAVAIPNPSQLNWPFTLALGLTVLGAAIRFRHDWPRCALWSLGLALVLSPVLHPWYAVWILPLACWLRVPAWSVFAVSALGGLLLWESTRFWTAWEPNPWTRAIVMLPPLIAWHIKSRQPSEPIDA